MAPSKTVLKNICRLSETTFEGRILCSTENFLSGWSWSGKSRRENTSAERQSHRFMSFIRIKVYLYSTFQTKRGDIMCLTRDETNRNTDSNNIPRLYWTWRYSNQYGACKQHIKVGLRRLILIDMLILSRFWEPSLTCLQRVQNTRLCWVLQQFATHGLLSVSSQLCDRKGLHSCMETEILMSHADILIGYANIC